MASKQQQQIIDNAGLFIDIANKYPHKEDDQKEDLQVLNFKNNIISLSIF